MFLSAQLALKPRTLPHFPIIGDQGKSLAEQWKDEVQAYLGIAVPHFQNYLSLLGPNCPVGNGPILIAVEHQASYITQMLSKFQKENVRSFAASSKATENFNAWKDKLHGLYGLDEWVQELVPG